MGIGKDAIKLLMKEGLRRSLRGSILTLGRQGVWVTEKELVSIAERLHYPLVKDIPYETSQDQMLAKRDCVSDHFLFRSLGFQKVYSIDYSSYEQADYIADLNQRQLPESIKEKFDFVLDSGTIEHIFHLPNALANIFDFATVEGRIMHLSPSSNHIDHGFYMFSPTLFFDFYKANNFEINNMQLISYAPNHDTCTWKIKEYLPGSLDEFSYGGLDSKMYAINCIVTKKPHSTAHCFPQQGSYVSNYWANTSPKITEKVGSRNISNRVKIFLKKIFFLRKTVHAIRRSFERKSLGLRSIDRF